jgi:hypothetical protein
VVPPDAVYVAEYFEIEERSATKVYLRNKVTEEEQVLTDPEPSAVDDLLVQGWEETRRRKIKRPRVHKYVLSGAEVLADEGLLPGKFIPVIPVYGKRWFVDNIERCAGHVRYAKDPQRIYNAEVSHLAEISAMAQHERPIFDPEQVAGHEQSWADGNIKRSPYQLANALRDDDGKVVQTGPIGTVEPPQVPPALAALVQLSANDVAEMTGTNESLDDVPANTSAQAIQLVQTRVDAKTFIYLDNMAKAMKRCGQVWRSMAAELYVEEGRQMQKVGTENGAHEIVTLAEPSLDPDGRTVLKNDLTKGRFDVVVDVGPASTTRRDATVRSLVGMAAAAANDPELQNVLLSTALVNMDGEGISEVQKWIRARLVHQGVLQPTEQEERELEEEAQNAQPDPNAQLAEAAAHQAEAEAESALAGAEEKRSQAALNEIKGIETLAGIAADNDAALLERARFITEGLGAPPQASQALQ